MPKLKTKKGAAKRLRMTKSGKIKRPRAGRGHIRTSKNRKRKRFLRHNDLVSSTEQRTIKKLLPYG
ncbi:MAG: 50S ribosomal protein L35 [Candidatus Omnitrophica bacterium]|nr:50S ribosomal protein L35 [Candidatus Omnitrophota bacterium]